MLVAERIHKKYTIVNENKLIKVDMYFNYSIIFIW